MFYLRQFYSFFMVKPLIVTSFLVMTLVLVLSGLERRHIDQKFEKAYFIEEERSYFNALLINPQDAGYIEEKVKSLPGVKNIIRTKKSDLVDSLAELKKKYTSLFEQSGLSNLIGLKVIYDNEIGVGNQSLIKEYIERLAGKRHIKLSKIFIPKKKQNDNVFFKKNLGIMVFVFAIIVWMIPFILLKKEFAQRFGLLSSFQRRQNIQFKIFGLSMLAIFCLSLVLTNVFSELSLKLCVQTLIVLTSLSFLFFDRLKWQN